MSVTVALTKLHLFYPFSNPITGIMFHKSHKIGKMRNDQRFYLFGSIMLHRILLSSGKIGTFYPFSPSFQFLVDDEGRAWFKDIRCRSGKSCFYRPLVTVPSSCLV
jgi:hypothetical protein